MTSTVYTYEYTPVFKGKEDLLPLLIDSPVKAGRGSYSNLCSIAAAASTSASGPVSVPVSVPVSASPVTTGAIEDDDDWNVQCILGWIAEYPATSTANALSVYRRCVRWSISGSMTTSHVLSHVIRGRVSMLDALRGFWPYYYENRKAQGADDYEELDSEFIGFFRHEMSILMSADVAYVASLYTETRKMLDKYDKIWPPATDLEKLPPPIPYDGMPTAMRDMIEASAQSIKGVNTNAVIGAAIATAEAAALNTRAVRVSNTWTVFLSVNFLYLDSSGGGKSPVMNIVTKCLEDLDKKAVGQDADYQKYRRSQERSLKREIQELSRVSASAAKELDAAKSGKTAKGEPATTSKISAATGMEKVAEEARKRLALSKAEARLEYLESTAKDQQNYRTSRILFDDITGSTAALRVASSWVQMGAIFSAETDLFAHVRSGPGAGDPMNVFIKLLGFDGIKVDRHSKEIIMPKAGIIANIMTQIESFEKYVSSNPEAYSRGLVPRFCVIYSDGGEALSLDRVEVPIRVLRAWEDKIKALYAASSRMISSFAIAESERVEKKISEKINDDDGSGGYDSDSENSDYTYREPTLLSVPEPLKKSWLDWEKQFVDPYVTAKANQEQRIYKSWRQKSTARMLALIATFTLFDDPDATVLNPDYFPYVARLMDAFAEHYRYLHESRSDYRVKAVHDKIIELHEEALDNLRNDGITDPATVRQRAYVFRKKEVYDKLKGRDWMKRSDSDRTSPYERLDIFLEQLDSYGQISYHYEGKGSSKARVVELRPKHLD